MILQQRTRATRHVYDREAIPICIKDDYQIVPRAWTDFGVSCRTELEVVLKISLIAVILLFSSACSVVEIHSPGAVTLIDRKFGVLRIALEDEHQTLVVKSRGIGLVPMFDGFAVGRAEEIMVVAKDATACRTIIFSEDSMPATLESWDWLRNPL